MQKDPLSEEHNLIHPNSILVQDDEIVIWAMPVELHTPSVCDLPSLCTQGMKVQEKTLIPLLVHLLMN